MADAIAAALRSIRTRRKAIESELKRLAKAEDALKKVIGSETNSKAPQKDSATSNADSRSVSSVVMKALSDLGESESSQVIQHIREKYMPEVNENTVRSLLSVWSVKGRIMRDGKKYSLPADVQSTDPASS